MTKVAMKVASNAEKREGAPATTTLANPGQSNISPTDQGEIPVIATNRFTFARKIIVNVSTYICYLLIVLNVHIHMLYAYCVHIFFIS
jgi:hypothetical protein